MHRARTTALAAVLWIILAQPTPSPARPVSAGVVDQARERLAAQDAGGAAALLEAALPGASAEARPALVALLREAYAAAARLADAAGRPDEAEAFRDNLSILERKPRAPAVNPAPATRIPLPPRPERLGNDPGVTRASEEAAGPPAQNFAAPLPAPPETPVVAPPQPAPGSIRPAVRAPSESPVEVPIQAAATPAPAQPEPDPAEVSVAGADAAFLARRYEEAGRRYTAIDRIKKLPADRRDHWAYCRAVEVVKRINARPASPREWASIDAEIARIRALSPTNWFGEYLRKVAAERNPGARAGKAPKSNKVVLRGSSPDDPAPPARVQPTPAAAAPGPPISWSNQPVVSENFQVAYPEGRRALAEQVSQAAEAARAVGVKRWGVATPGLPWSPRCEVVLFPNAADFSRETGQPPDSPGFSTMGLNTGKIVFRRVNLRIDHPNMVKAILPHEVTHVVLADLFPQKQIPRWADEGMAVLSEPPSEQNLRASDLEEPLTSGRLFKLSDLMVMDYPDARFWSLYYAQSVSLTRFLVEQGGPDQFVKFVQEAQRAGVEPAMKQVYQITSYTDLQARWLSYARTKAPSELTASSADARKPSAAATR